MSSYQYKKTSEELNVGGFDYPIDEDFHLIRIGATTVLQLKMAGIFPKKEYGSLNTHKPDCLVVSGKNDIQVLVEYKALNSFKNISNARSAITDWYFTLAKKLGCRIICATDGVRSCWVSAGTADFIKENEKPITDVFNSDIIISDPKTNGKLLSSLIQKIKAMDTTGTIKSRKVLNPQKLADKVWQKIWVNTGKNPESCLYNVVEIFIFKFLSDLGVLPDHLTFDKTYDICLSNGAEDGLTFYANSVRPKIKDDMFPKGEDGTTILNGTIFVNEEGKANIAQANLFKDVLKDFFDYGKKEGPFQNIDKNFKTRLYESFLRKEAGISTMGQFFTPRNVVQAMIEMNHTIQNNARICDPFCGVGGFILEILNHYDNLKDQYIPKSSTITTDCELLGFDKGTDERDDARTIILAKANMLIYFSDLLETYFQQTLEFAKKFNDTFHLIKSNTGTFSIDKYKDYFDYIFSNPPYVVKGTTSIKATLKEEGLLKTMYPSNGLGLESLAMEWILYSLKPGGKAFVVIPTGILRRQQDSTLRQNILEKCYIDGIISLPPKTFYSTIQKTYIIAITKKPENEKNIQKSPVFAYLVSQIGETLDSNRFPIEENDLSEMSKLFKIFCIDKKDFTSTSKRCKVIPINDFQKNWVIDEHWSEEELISLGIKTEFATWNEADFKNSISDYADFVKKVSKKYKPLSESYKFSDVPFKEILKWEKGKSKYTRDYMVSHVGPYKVFTADTLGDYTSKYPIDSFDWEGECIRLTTNGEYAGTFTYINEKRYSMNGDAGRIIIKEDFKDSIYLPYINWTLQDIRRKKGFNWTKKPTNKDVYKIIIPIPINEDGSYDIAAQKKIAEQHSYIEKIRNQLKNQLTNLIDSGIDF